MTTENNTYDVIVVGAGINGIGIARDAVLRGLSVLLIEQEDVCAGVSAWSGRLVHGGLRYLEHLDFGLVYESLTDRERLFHNAPHLVRPVSWMMPVYKHNRRPGWMVELGMILFDMLSFKKTAPWHRYLSRSRTLRRFPGISPDGLKGSVVFYDGQVELAERLCVELTIDARRNGANVLTHSKVDAPLMRNGRVAGVTYVDRLTEVRGEAFASIVINAAGPWIDRVFTDAKQPRLNGGTKGSHLIVDHFPGAPTDVVYYESRHDGRLVLVIPWMGRYMLGTTDIRWESEPDDARCDIGEAEYLLGEVNALVPDANLSMADVLYTYSGVRPLPYVPDKAESSVPRTHVLYDHAKHGLPGLVTVVGGKLTTFRQLAEDAVDLILRELGKASVKTTTRKRLLPGAIGPGTAAVVARLTDLGLNTKSAKRLAWLYGSRALDVWALTTDDARLAKVIDGASGAIGAEVVLAVREEFARTLTDVMARRILLAFEPNHGRAAELEVASIMAGLLGWDAVRVEQEIAGYHTWLGHLAIPDVHGPRSASFGAGTPEPAR